MIARDLPAGPTLRGRIRFTDRDDGDFRVDGPLDVLARRRRAVAGGRWTWLRQVHGSTVVAVDEPGAGAGVEADASVTTVPGAVLAVQTADCAPVVLVADGAVAVAHAGWRGLVDGVLAATVDEVRARAPGPISAVIGPCIAPLSYEFGPDELSRVVAVAGSRARASTSEGLPALDLPAAVTSLLRAAGVHRVDDLALDTASPRFWSHRVRHDLGRQATVVWLEPTGPAR